MADKRAAVVPIGCGECKECRKAKQREWQVRLKEDIKHNTNGKFIIMLYLYITIRKYYEIQKQNRGKRKCYSNIQ